MYFKDVAHSYGMSYERMTELGDRLVWVYIITMQGLKKG